MVSGNIVNSGKYRALQLLAADLGYYEVGMSATVPTVLDTALGRKVPINGTSQCDSCDAITGWTASGSNSVSLNTTNYKEGTGSLNLIKSDATSAAINASKTTTSVHFTSADFWVFVYISASALAKLATSTCLEIRFGSDSSNYYYKQYNLADLAAGWNCLSFSSATATGTNGTPVIAACDYSMVKYTTTNATDTTSAGDFVFDDLKVATAAAYLLPISAGYPVADATSDTMTSRVALASTDANGYPLVETGLFNATTMFSHDTFTLIDKNNTMEIIFEWIDVFE